MSADVCIVSVVHFLSFINLCKTALTNGEHAL
jgi:hypothetical protein